MAFQNSQPVVGRSIPLLQQPLRQRLAAADNRLQGIEINRFVFATIIEAVALVEGGARQGEDLRSQIAQGVTPIA